MHAINLNLQKTAWLNKHDNGGGGDNDNSLNLSFFFFFCGKGQYCNIDWQQNNTDWNTTFEFKSGSTEYVLYVLCYIHIPSDTLE